MGEIGPKGVKTQYLHGFPGTLGPKSLGNPNIQWAPTKEAGPISWLS